MNILESIDSQNNKEADSVTETVYSLENSDIQSLENENSQKVSTRKEVISSYPINNTFEPIIEDETELVSDVSQRYSGISGDISGNTLSIGNAIVARYAAALIAKINSANQSILSSLNGVKGTIFDALQEIPGVDESIKDVDLENFSFADIWQTAKRIEGRSVKQADKAFFEQCGYTVEGNIVTIGEYTYNIRSGVLKANGVNVKARFYIPEGFSDYSKVNTLTAFSAFDKKTKSNAIIISLGQTDGLKTSQVTTATKFINKVAGTDLSKCQCKPPHRN